MIKEILKNIKDVINLIFNREIKIQIKLDLSNNEEIDKFFKWVYEETNSFCINNEDYYWRYYVDLQ